MHSFFNLLWEVWLIANNLFRELWLLIAGVLFWHRREARYVVIFGAPGAGKDTISPLLSAKLELPILGTGTLISKKMAEDESFRQKWEPVVKSGRLVPDSVVLSLARAELSKPEYVKGAILNGLPRTVLQAKGLRRMLAWWGNKVNRVVLLDISEADVVERLSQRLTCTNKSCRATYHAKVKPPKVHDVCDVCKSKIGVRDDDKPEVVTKRQQIFRETFAPLCSYYEQSRLLTRVVTNNERTIEQVLGDVLFTIEQFD